ncbi:VOC family protein [Herbaspirillum sp. LeCh32-8]|uniref:VOC family protein n=1 Tax=Herbaspirillum sp. LeCh32-8 TaxID=2821356 RepID=UPI001AE5FCC9|nr:VOC family protein [Herbaspirillum sp. LeCh32-8]MBP0598795.1 VOC family protein [Herbaspirillum sp. LeCh32-8]
MPGATLHTEPDHLVVTAATLEAGMNWVAEMIGVSMAPRIGGEHLRLGTHNALMSLGPGFYLEVIAVNPAAPRPSRARWFGMDALAPDAPPRVAHWVARTGDIHAAAQAATINPGIVEEMSRGSLQWLITIAADGALPCDGAMPSLIQWQSEPHPAAALPDLGCRLVQLNVVHPQAPAIRASLHAIGLQEERLILRDAAAPKITASIMTPQGLKTLG